MLDVEELANEIVKKLTESHHAIWLDSETHAAQHEFIMLLMNEHQERRLAQQEKATRRKAIEDKIAGSLILMSILGLVGLIGSGVLTWLRDHIK